MVRDPGKSALGVVSRIGKWIILSIFLFLTFVPLIWLLVSSLKTNLELTATNPFGLPEVWQWGNYANAVQISGLPRLFFNSAVVSISSTALNMLITAMGAFALTREVFKGQRVILNAMLAGVLIPIIALMVPYFKIISGLGIYDTLLGLILTYAAINIPISVYLMSGFMQSIPKELEEAAVIDGCSFAQRFTQIIFPLSRLGLVTAGTFVFLYSWNEFIYALLLTQSVRARTLQLGIQFFRSQFFIDYTSMFAAIVITIIPTVAVYIGFHENIIKGMTSGAVKG
jgi:raffinose/stachyose/melibiose transport system permease protein